MWVPYLTDGPSQPCVCGRDGIMGEGDESGVAMVLPPLGCAGEAAWGGGGVADRWFFCPGLLIGVFIGERFLVCCQSIHLSFVQSLSFGLACKVW